MRVFFGEACLLCTEVFDFIGQKLLQIRCNIMRVFLVEKTNKRSQCFLMKLRDHFYGGS